MSRYRQKGRFGAAMHGSGIGGPGAAGAARATAVAASTRTTNHITDRIELAPRNGRYPVRLLFKPIRVKLALTLRPLRSRLL
jgi:hypothetical protein